MKVAVTKTVYKLVDKLVDAITENHSDDPLVASIVEILDQANKEDAITTVEDDGKEQFIEIDDEIVIMILTGAIASAKGSRFGRRGSSSTKNSFFSKFKKKDKEDKD